MFAGYLPAAAPRAVVVVMVDEPKGEKHTGGAVAAPIFAEIGAAAMQRLRVLPDAPPPLSDPFKADDIPPATTAWVMPVASVPSLTAALDAGSGEDRDASARRVLTPVVNGIAAGAAKPGAATSSLQVATPISEELPSFIGLSARQSIRRFSRLGVDAELVITGAGVVTGQRPPAGTPLKGFGDDVGDGPREVKLELARR